MMYLAWLAPFVLGFGVGCLAVAWWSVRCAVRHVAGIAERLFAAETLRAGQAMAARLEARGFCVDSAGCYMIPATDLRLTPDAKFAMWMPPHLRDKAHAADGMN